MAPLTTTSIVDLDISSLELDVRSTTLDEIISRAMPLPLHKRDNPSPDLSPNEVFHKLTARDDAGILAPDHSGAVDPNDINMKGLQALFAIIGASFVVAIIWFFFWAKNGGFQWRKGDWDDYKSTVLRRKGPNGTTLSNATKSTRLGNGSVVGKGYSDGSGSTVDGTYTETMTEMSSEAPIMQENYMKRETAKEKKLREVREANFEGGHDQDVLNYIREKPARVGGINKDSDAFHYGTDYTDTEGSAIHSSRQSRVGGPRVASTSRQASPEKRQSRRDFSYGNDDVFSTVSCSHPEQIPVDYPTIPPPAQHADLPPPTPPHRPGRYHSPSKQLHQDAGRRSTQYPPVDMQNQNTKAYHHPLPTLTSQSPVRGYRRDRRDSLDD